MKRGMPEENEEEEEAPPVKRACQAKQMDAQLNVLFRSPCPDSVLVVHPKTWKGSMAMIDGYLFDVSRDKTVPEGSVCVSTRPALKFGTLAWVCPADDILVCNPDKVVIRPLGRGQSQNTNINIADVKDQTRLKTHLCGHLIYVGQELDVGSIRARIESIEPATRVGSRAYGRPAFQTEMEVATTLHREPAPTLEKKLAVPTPDEIKRLRAERQTRLEPSQKVIDAVRDLLVEGHDHITRSMVVKKLGNGRDKFSLNLKRVGELFAKHRVYYQSPGANYGGDSGTEEALRFVG